jgi:predicted MPP superfamily phosphohydrolase
MAIKIMAIKTVQDRRSLPQSPGRRRFLKLGAVAAVTGLGTSGYAYEIEPAHPKVTRHDIKIDGWPPSAAGLKIGQLSDLHCQDDRSVARTAHAARMLLALAPDIVFLTGDYISNGQGADWAAASANALAPLKAVPRGVFAILGNHDYAAGRSAEVAAALEAAGFHVLRNRAAPLPGAESVWLVGMESRCLFATNPVQALTGVPAEAVKILLVHEPDYADEAPLGFALQLSGHSHAGQIRIPGLPPLHCPEYGQKYPEGLQQAQNHRVYTSRGVGMMGPQMRFCCPPEVTLLTIYPA